MSAVCPLTVLVTMDALIIPNVGVPRVAGTLGTPPDFVHYTIGVSGRQGLKWNDTEKSLR